MNLYEFEGKNLFFKHGIKIPKGINLKRGDDTLSAYESLNLNEVVVKAQILSGKRGKNNGIKFCSSGEEVKVAVEEMFETKIKGMHVAAVRIEEKLDISEEHYLSITYDTNKKIPILIYSSEGGVDIEDVDASQILNFQFSILKNELPEEVERKLEVGVYAIAKELWRCFLEEDTRLVEINPLVKTKSGEWIAADAKVAIDDDAFYRHSPEKFPDATDWTKLEPRTEMGRPPTKREIAVKKIDEGEGYYRGTAGKYIEMDGDIALILNGGGASIANMDALINAGLKPANYTEYSGNPPREKVYELTKLILSKPGIKGLWACGVVSNFTNVRETFLGFADALDEIKPKYPIVIRRDGPEGEAGRKLIMECAERNGLNMKVFGKETPMTETAQVLADMINQT